MELSISFSHFYHIYKLSLSKPCIFHKFTERDSEIQPLRLRLSLWESWREAPERARALTGKRRHGDGIALTKRQLIAVRRLSGEELALSVIASQCHSPGCGSQRLLRCRLHPAGRCPNSSSLFPPLAAVVAVAPKGRGFRTPLSFPHPLRLPRFFHAKKDRCISATAFPLRIRRGDDSRIS